MWLGLLVALGSLIIMFYGFTRFAVKLFTGTVGEVVDAKLGPVFAYQLNMTHRVDGIAATIDDVQAQLHPNAGTSLRDQVNKIGERVGVEHADSHPPRSGITDH